MNECQTDDFDCSAMNNERIDVIVVLFTWLKNFPFEYLLILLHELFLSLLYQVSSNL